MQDDLTNPATHAVASVDALIAQGDALRQARRPHEALPYYDQALRLAPNLAEVWKTRGNALRELGLRVEALQSYRQALRVRPDFPEALNNSGVVLQELDQPEAALACYRQAMQLRPDDPATLTNCGVTLQSLGHPEMALAHFRSAIRLRPDAVDAHFGAALCLLHMGEYAEGWREYEWRWRSAYFAHWRRSFTQPLWLGQHGLAGRTILLHAEQGLGDTLQFCRFVTQVAARGAKVLLEVQPALKSLLQQLPGVAAVLAQGEPLPDFDWHCPLLSLPYALGMEATSLPARVPYLRADPAKVAHWRQRLRREGRVLIGLAWSGNPAHIDDRHRSLALATLAPWFDAAIRERIDFVALQNEIRDTDLEAMRTFQISDVRAQLTDFTDTAALVDSVDYVLTVDTALAHLAGALNRPTTVLLPFRADHRWLRGRDDSPWYPSLRLARQPTRGDWDTLLRRIADKLRVP